MSPTNCALPGCNAEFKRHKVYIKPLKSLKFLKQGTEEYEHQEALQKFVLAYRDPKSKEDKILSQIHRSQCGICKRHFKPSDFKISSKDNVEFSPLLVEDWRAALSENRNGDLLFPGRGSSGRKFLKVGALPTENLPVKSFQKPLKPERRTIVKHPLPVPIVHREFGCVRKSIEKHFLGKDGSDWNFSFYVDKIVARYKTDVSSMFELVLRSNFTYELFHHGLKCAAPNLDKIDLHITTVSTFLNAVSVLRVCTGFDFMMKHTIRQIISYRKGTELILKEVYRSALCPVIIDGGDGSMPLCTHCTTCKQIFKKLQSSKVAYQRKKQGYPLRRLTANASESRLRQTVQFQNTKIVAMKAELKKFEQHIELDLNTAQDVHQLMENSTDDFFRLFYSEQVKLQAQHRNGRRFHPDIIRFALTLAMKSPSCYDDLKKVLILPSRRTLMDYRNAEKPSTGWTSQTTRFIQAYSDECQENEKFVFITVDEMTIKQDLAYDSSTGMLVGFTDIGNRDNPRADELATHALAIYVKSFCGKPGLKYPIAYFGSTSLTGSQLASILWESIALLEKHGLQVHAVVADGLAANRCMFKCMGADESTPYQTINWFSSNQDRQLLLIPDPPHLLKTTRNCLFSSRESGTKTSRLIHCNGKFILWKHIQYVESQNWGELTRNRLTARHVRLTSYSKMNVKLAAQTLSASVAKSLKNAPNPYKRAEMEETAKFVEIMDLWFDYMNTRPGHGKTTLKMYTDIHDPRLEWLEGFFVPHLIKWREANLDKFGRGSLEKSYLSKQTYEGLCMATMGMVTLVRSLLNRGLSSVATRRISQDSLEAYFGHQRSMGRRNENPTIQQFGYRNNAITLKRQLHYATTSSTPLKKRRCGKI